jgi:hypothetical protein
MDSDVFHLPHTPQYITMSLPATERDEVYVAVRDFISTFLRSFNAKTCNGEGKGAPGSSKTSQSVSR